jgi:glycosyltransferase involved in cell wall biosynthesis
LKLLVLGPYGETTSGPSRVVTEVVSNLSEDIRILVLSPKRRRDHDRNDFVTKNIDVRFQSCGQIPGLHGSHQWIEMARIFRRLQELSFRPDLVWTHSGALHTVYSLSKFRKVPSVSTVHGVYGAFYKSEASQRRGGITASVLAAQSTLLQRRELKTATLLTTYSDYLKQLIVDVSPQSRVVVIPNGANTERFRMSTGPREKRIVYVGRMAKIKGVHILIDAMREVAQDYPDWALWLVGGVFDQPRSFFENYLTPDTRNRVEFLGAIPNDELPAVLNQAGIFVMPTLRDGFEIALMEAMASGIPCVTTSAFERVNLYSGFAEMVPPERPRLLGQKLAYMIEHYSDYTIKSEVQRRVNRAREFDWAAIAQRYERLFRKVAR